ncbi:MAG: hypothetical protein EOP51_31740, partial [Sphingobacteriales bacterium]
AYYPSNGSQNVVLNPLIEASVSQVLKASSVNANTVQIRKDYSGAVHPATISLSEDGRVIRIKPLTSLQPNATYYVRFYTGLEDIDGDKLRNEDYSYFYTGATAIADTQSPVIQRTSPSDGAVDVPVNPTFYVRFDEAIHPFSVLPKGNDQVSFSEGNKVIRYVKDHVLKDNSQIKETWSGISDGSGNLIADRTITFNTGNRVDAKDPGVTNITPASGAVGVPVNTRINVLMTEPINTVAVTSASFYLYDTVLGTSVNATTAISSDGRQLSLTPSAPLAVSRRYTVYLSAIQDLVGNTDYESYDFTTGVAADTAAPQVSMVSVDEALVDVPLNARLRVRFNEAVNIQKLDKVTLTLNGLPITVAQELSSDRLTITLTPQQLLQSNTTYTFTVSGIEDLSGNVLVAPTVRHFTTSTKVDNVQAVMGIYTPASG